MLLIDGKDKMQLNDILKSILILMKIFLLISCGENRHLDNNIKTINLDIQDNSIKLSSLVSDISYVSLESKEICLLGNIDKIIFLKNRFYILDKHNTKSLFVFNKSGKFLFKISDIGKGPGEYIEPFDFIVNKNSSFIQIMDPNLRKVIVYDSLGTFLSEKRFDFNAFFFEQPEELNYVFSTGNTIDYNRSGKKIILTDNKLNPISSFLDIGNHKELRIFPFSIFSWYNDTLYYVPMLNYEVYKIYNNHFDMILRINFNGEELVAESNQEENFIKKTKRVLNSNYAFNISNFIINETYISFNFTKNKKYYLTIINKSDLNRKLIIKSFINDIDFMPINNIWWQMGDSYLSIIEPTTIIELVRDLPSEIKVKLPPISRNLMIMDNPIICIIKLKNQLI